MNNKLEVIGIDHGWSMMKTISQVFVTGVILKEAEDAKWLTKEHLADVKWLPADVTLIENIREAMY